MQPYAQAFVVVPYLDHAHGFRGISRQAIQVETAACFFLCDIFGGDGQMAGYNLIDLLFQLFNLLWGRTGFKPVIQLAFFALDVCRYGTPAAEEPDHGLIDDMFRRVHRRVLRFVMLVELNLLFHAIISLNCGVNSSGS